MAYDFAALKQRARAKDKENIALSAKPLSYLPSVEHKTEADTPVLNSTKTVTMLPSLPASSMLKNTPIKTLPMVAAKKVAQPTQMPDYLTSFPDSQSFTAVNFQQTGKDAQSNAVSTALLDTVKQRQASQSMKYMSAPDRQSFSSVTFPQADKDAQSAGAQDEWSNHKWSWFLSDGEKLTRYLVDDKYRATLDFEPSKFDNIRNLTDQEKNNILSLAANGDYDGAKSYYDSLADTLEQRRGSKTADTIMSIDNPVLRGTATTALGYGSGVSTAVTGLGQAVSRAIGNTDPIVGNSTTYANGIVRPQLSGISGVASDLASSAGFMTPGIVTSAITGIPALGAAVMGLSSAGDTYNQERRNGKDDTEALIYAGSIGALEGGLQYLLGGVGALGKGGTSKILANSAVGSAVLSKVDDALKLLAKSPQAQSLLQSAAKVGGFTLKMNDEGFEEWLQANLQPVIRNIVFGEDNQIQAFSSDKLYSYFLGALSAGLMNATSAASNAVSNYSGNTTTQAQTPSALPMKEQTAAPVFMPGASTQSTASSTTQLPNVQDTVQTTQDAPQAPQAPTLAPFTLTAQTSVPEVKETAQAPMQNNANTLYREIGPDRLESYFSKGTLDLDTPYGGTELINVSKSPELAIGQGENTGIKLEFDSTGVPLKKVNKPFNPDNGEYLIDDGGRDISHMQDYLRPNLKKVTIDKSLVGEVTADDVESNRQRAILKARLNNRAIRILEQRGWIKSFDENGNLVFESPKYPTLESTPVEQTNATAQAEQAATPVVDSTNVKQEVVQSGKHIDERQYSDVSSPKVKAFQYDNPQLHSYFAEAAKGLSLDLSNSTKGEKNFIYNDNADLNITGTKRSTTSEIERLLDNADLSYAQIQKAVDDLIADHGQENYAAAKKVELVLDEMLTNGYTAVDGDYIEPNANYIAEKNAIKNGGTDEYSMSEDAWNALMQEEPSQNVSVGAADEGFDPYTGLQNKYGNLPAGEKAVRSDDMPAQTADNNKVSLTARTVLGAEATPDSMVESIEQFVVDGKLSYIPITNKATEAKVTAAISKKGFTQALTDWTADVRSGKTSADITATGAVLLNNSENSKDGKLTLDILSDYALSLRNAGQAAQAARILKTLTPSGKLYIAQKSVNSISESIGTDISIDPDLATEFLNAEDDATRDAVLDKIYQNVADQVPSTFADKWNAWRYLSMLGNLKTQVRNVAGNAGFQPVRIVKDKIAAWVAALVDKPIKYGIQRTKSFVTDPALFKAASADFANVQQEALGEAKYTDPKKGTTAAIEGKRTIFKTKWIEAWRKATNKAMEVGDVWFSRFTYADALSGYLKANGVTAEQFSSGNVNAELLDAARTYAIQEAQKATYRDKNQFSNTVSQLGKNYTGDSAVGKVANAVVEGVLPFKRTPANILVRAEEYSPFGFINTIVEANKASKGESSAAVVIDKAASALTGTGLLALGAYLFSQGFVTGGDDEDEKQADFNDLTGNQPYALQLPDGTSITLDWLAPESMPFFMGVELARNIETNGLSLSSATDALRSITSPMLEMSMLQGVNDMIDSVSYSEDKLPALATAALVSYISQGIPTLTGQAERTSEGTRMTTYTDKTLPLSTNAQYAIGKAAAKIPGLDFQQIPYINAWGEKESNGTLPQRIFNNFVNPSYTSKVGADKTETELQRLYTKTSESGVLPSRADKKITVDGKDINLTGKQYVEFATTQGETKKDTLDAMMETAQYKAMPDTEKAGAVERAYTYALSIAKAEISDYEPDRWVLQAQTAKKDLGVSTEDYLLLCERYGTELLTSDKLKEAYKAGFKPQEYLDFRNDLSSYGGENISQDEAQHVLDSTKLKKSQKDEMWHIINKAWKTNPYD